MMNRDTILQQVREIVLRALSEDDVIVYLFGSWARMEEKRSSDIDVAIKTAHPIHPLKWNGLLEDLENSTIPYHVEVVNFDHANLKLKAAIEKEGIVWKNYRNVSH